MYTAQPNNDPITSNFMIKFYLKKKKKTINLHWNRIVTNRGSSSDSRGFMLRHQSITKLLCIIKPTGQVRVWNQLNLNVFGLRRNQCTHQKEDKERPQTTDHTVCCEATNRTRLLWLLSHVNCCTYFAEKPLKVTKRSNQLSKQLKGPSCPFLLG